MSQWIQVADFSLHHTQLQSQWPHIASLCVNVLKIFFLTIWTHSQPFSVLLSNQEGWPITTASIDQLAFWLLFGFGQWKPDAGDWRLKVRMRPVMLWLHVWSVAASWLPSIEAIALGRRSFSYSYSLWCWQLFLPLVALTLRDGKGSQLLIAQNTAPYFVGFSSPYLHLYIRSLS